MKKLIAVFFSVLLGCTSGPSLKGEVVDIDHSKLNDYWLESTDFQKFTTSFYGKNGNCRTLESSVVKGSDENKYAIYSFIIDSNGEIFERQYLDVQGEPELNLKTLKIMAENIYIIDGSTYMPSPRNTNRVPVRVQLKEYIVETFGPCN